MPLKIREVDCDLVRQWFHYDPQTGAWLNQLRTPDMFYPDKKHPCQRRECDSWNKRFAFRQAKPQAKTKYIRVEIFGRNYGVHRLAFLYVTGRWPAETIDHVNGDRFDNRWDNLREATHQQNSANRSIKITSHSGYKGVYRCCDCERWRAEIHASGKRTHLGLFITPEDAAEAYKKAATLLHGDFAYFGARRPQSCEVST